MSRRMRTRERHAGKPPKPGLVRPARMWITRLDADGNPSGPRIEGFSLLGLSAVPGLINEAMRSAAVEEQRKQYLTLAGEFRRTITGTFTHVDPELLRIIFGRWPHPWRRRTWQVARRKTLARTRRR